MENIEKMQELLESINDAFIIELSLNENNIHCGVLEILEEDVIQDLERVLNKIKSYSNKINDLNI